jgi:hypothetical protein
VEEAQKEAFANVKYEIDISSFPAKDPNYEENLLALRKGRSWLKNRFVTSNPYGYVVSEEDEKGKQKITFFYNQKGELMIVRLFSNPDFPRTEYLYCAQKQCAGNKKMHEKGELIRVTFHPSITELFYFNPDGSFDRKG